MIVIVIADKGWVFVGSADVSDTWVRLTHAMNIRRWGTQRGLGELVQGPLPSTVLDPAGTVDLPMSAVIALIQCNAAAWADQLGT